MTPSAGALLRADSEGRFDDAHSRAAEYVASVAESLRLLSPASPEAAQLVAGALASLEEARRLALCKRAALAIQLEDRRNARRYAGPAGPASTVEVTG
jgi:hypothetical protein